ncbi:hypothetical protein JCM3775_002971 [Rhodotorula graminis]
MSPAHSLTHQEYAKRLHEIVYPRLPGDSHQQAIVVAWLSWLQQGKPYHTFSQLGSRERQQHFFAVVGRVSFDKVPLILTLQDHAAGQSSTPYKPAARDTSASNAPAPGLSVFQRRFPSFAHPQIELSPTPVETITNSALYDLNPLAYHRPTYRPRRHDALRPPNKPWDHNAVWPDRDHSPPANGHEEDSHFSNAWHDGL